MELAIQFIFNHKSVRSDTQQDLKEFNSESLATQAERGEHFVSMMPATKKTFNLMGDDIVELSVENEPSKNQVGYYDEKRLQQSNAKPLEQINDKKELI